MSNKGVVPFDVNSPVGRFRALIGDTSYEPLCPEEPGFGDYKMFSDSEIELFLEASESTEGAVSFAYFQLAGAAAMEAKVVKDYDLQVDLSKRATELRLLAAMWQERADAAGADIFEVFDTVSPERCDPELAPYPVNWGPGCGRRLF